MKRHAEIARLKDIRKIYAAQQASAELEVERLNVRIDGLRDRLDAAHDHLAGLEQGWQKAVGDESLQLAVQALWSAEILRTHATIEKTDQAMADSHAQRAASCAAARIMSARADAADTLIVRARRQVARQQEETALEDHFVRTRSVREVACA